jgi:hypothetical protein
MENKAVYKIGGCFRNRHDGQLVRITEVITSEDGIHLYNVQCLDSGRKSRYPINYSKLLMNYEYSPMAQVLYSNTVTTNQGVKNEKDAKQLWITNNRG